MNTQESRLIAPLALLRTTALPRRHLLEVEEETSSMRKACPTNFFNWLCNFLPLKIQPCYPIICYRKHGSAHSVNLPFTLLNAFLNRVDQCKKPRSTAILVRVKSVALRHVDLNRHAALHMCCSNLRVSRPQNADRCWQTEG